MDELKQLDAVLKVLANYNENRTYHFITIGLTKYLDKVPPEHRMKEILLYLEEKRYITITREYPTDKSMMKCTFSLTLEGRVLMQKGGFVKNQSILLNRIKVTTPPTKAQKMISDISIGLFVAIVGGLILYFLLN